VQQKAFSIFILLSLSCILGASSARLRNSVLSNSLLRQGASSKNPPRDNSSAHCVGPCLGFTLRMGGDGGTQFDDLNQNGLFNMRSITVSVDSRGTLNGIQVDYDNGAAPWHGRNDGTTHTCHIRSGGSYDPIVSYLILHNSQAVQGITFLRKSGLQCGPYGGHGAFWATNVGPPPSLASTLRPGADPLKQMVLSGVFGRSSDRMDGLGFYFGQDLSTCDNVLSTSGRWINIRNFPVETEFAIEIGTTHTDEFGRSSEWGRELALTVSAGFEFGGASGSVEVGSTWSESIAQSYSSSFERSTTKTTTFSFPAGSLWQWQFLTVDPCGTSMTFQDYQITPNAHTQPCCPPGLFENPTKPNGYCVDDSLSLPISSCPKQNL